MGGTGPAGGEFLNYIIIKYIVRSTSGNEKLRATFLTHQQLSVALMSHIERPAAGPGAPVQGGLNH